MKFLTIACLAKIAVYGPADSSQDHPQSLFEGAKGAKVLKLAISAVISALSVQTEANVELIRLCAVALEAIGPDVIQEWTALKTSGQHIKRLKEKTDYALDGELLQAVFPSLIIFNYSIPCFCIFCRGNFLV